MKSRDNNDDDDDDVFVSSVEDCAASASVSTAVTDSKRRSQSLSALTNDNSSASSHAAAAAAAAADVSQLNCHHYLSLSVLLVANSSFLAIRFQSLFFFNRQSIKKVEVKLGYIIVRSKAYLNLVHLITITT